MDASTVVADSRRAALLNLEALLDRHRSALEGGLRAADIGQFWNYEKPDEPWRPAFKKLGELLEAYVKEHPELELVDPGTPRLALRNAVPATADSRAARERPNTRQPFSLRPDVYKALVHEDGDPLYIDLKSLELAHSQIDGDGLIEVAPVGRQAQHRWALAFLEEQNLGDDPELIATLDSDLWYVRFADALESRSPKLARRWRSFRSACVASHLEEWCSQHDVPVAPFLGSGPSEPKPRHLSREAREAQRRDLVLKALSRLGTDDLLRIPIPACHLLDVVEPLLVHAVRDPDTAR